MLVIANPVAAAFGFGQVPRLAAQAAAGFDGFCFKRLVHLTFRSGLEITNPVMRRRLSSFRRTYASPLSAFQRRMPRHEIHAAIKVVQVALKLG